MSGLFDLFKREGCFDGYPVHKAVIELTPIQDEHPEFLTYGENGIHLTLEKKTISWDKWWLSLIEYIGLLDVTISFGVLWTSTVKQKDVSKRNVPAKVRVQVLDRDNSTCQLCGATIADGVKLHVDHIVPLSKGGTNELDNLQTLCQDCNLGKSDSTDLNMVRNKLVEGESDG